MAPAADGMYVKLPIPPELAGAARAWVERGIELARLFTDANVAGATFVDELKKAAAAVRADVDRLTRPKRGRSPR
jgi:hypothetical protein